MSDTLAHEYAREGNIDALNEYISSNPNDINSKNDVSILVYICNYLIYHQVQYIFKTDIKYIININI